MGITSYQLKDAKRELIIDFFLFFGAGEKMEGKIQIYDNVNMITEHKEWINTCNVAF